MRLSAGLGRGNGTALAASATGRAAFARGSGTGPAIGSAGFELGGLGGRDRRCDRRPTARRRRDVLRRIGVSR